MKGKRSKLTAHGARSLFRATSRPKARNYLAPPMRGGYRI